MLLNGEMNVSGKWEVHCSECGVTVDIIPTEEILPLIEYLTRKNKTVLCFDCDDAGNVDYTPLALLPELFGGVVIVDGLFKIEEDINDNLCLKITTFDACLVNHNSTHLQDA